VKVTNGDNADGSEILGASARNSKSFWADIDWWYAPESGVTFIDYYGKKDNLQTDLLGNQFTFHPVISRQGLFGNYKLFSTVDFLGGYLHSNDGWVAPDGSSAKFIANDFYGAVDYYIKQGLAVSGRYDLLHQKITGGQRIRTAIHSRLDHRGEQDAHSLGKRDWPNRLQLPIWPRSRRCGEEY